MTDTIAETYDNQKARLLTMGRTGEGKGRQALSALLTGSMPSVLVLDIDGEARNVTAHQHLKCGPVVVFNPFDL